MLLPSLGRIKSMVYAKGYQKVMQIYGKAEDNAKKVADAIHKGETPEPRDIKQFKKFFYKHREKKEKEMNSTIIEMLVRWEKGEYDKKDASIIIYEWLETIKKGKNQDLLKLGKMFG